MTRDDVVTAIEQTFGVIGEAMGRADKAGDQAEIDRLMLVVRYVNNGFAVALGVAPFDDLAPAPPIVRPRRQALIRRFRSLEAPVRRRLRWARRQADAGLS